VRTAVTGELKIMWKGGIVAYVERGMVSQDLSRRTEMERLKLCIKNICFRV
jgi:hypothetical protein